MALEAGNADLAAQLGDHTSGSDLTSLLLDVADRQASRRSASDVLRQYERDRFTRPAAVAPATLLSTTATVAGSVGPNFDFVELAPLVPLGTHSVIAGVAQNRVVSTVRATEVAADPTNTLALEAAVRRHAQAPRGPTIDHHRAARRGQPSGPCAGIRRAAQLRPLHAAGHGLCGS